MYLLSIGRQEYNKTDKAKCDFLIRRIRIVEDALIRTIILGEDFTKIIAQSEHLLERFFPKILF
ncbi:NR LBD domain-containing protein [Caenorhabditis elegans]|nr:NR LBD domain-containing protein [Caenorhabditis elegans]CTQ87083.1 NR LBD domain-containing protein [Caenorhabditis elegans]|eukprot:NP_001300372.1 Uncharacterized protein CELE_R04A9.9 [Caenorhabditis elegans]